MTLVGKPTDPSRTGELPTLGELTVDEMLGRIGAASLSPGGGAVAALVTALAAALAEMAAGYAVRRSGTAHDLSALHRETHSARHGALRPADADAYAGYTQRQYEHRQRPHTGKGEAP